MCAGYVMPIYSGLVEVMLAGSALYSEACDVQLD